MFKFSRRTFLYAQITVVLAITVMDIYFWKHTQTFILSNLQADLSKKVSLARKMIDKETFEQKDKGRLKNFADEIKNLTGYRTTLIDKNGDVLADSELPILSLENVENHFTRPEVQQAMRIGSGLDIRTSATINKPLVYYCETFRVNGRITGFIRFAVFSPEYKERSAYVKGVIIRINLFLFVLAGLAAVIYWQWFNRQLRKISTPIFDQRTENIFHPISEQRYQEFESLRGEINQLGGKLENQKKILGFEKNQLASILHSLKDGVAAFDHKGYLIFYNTSFSHVLQIQADLTEELPFYDWIHFPPIIQDIEKYLSDHEPVRKRTKYYKNMYIDYQILPLQSRGMEEGGFIVLVQDVTHLQQLETIRQDFVANVSHEFKTPLTAIRGYAETLLEGVEDKPEVRLKFLNRIYDQTRHLENLVGDLLLLSRIEKKEVAELENLEVFPLIKEIISEFTPHARSKKIEIHQELDQKDASLKVYANPNLIHTLLSNLVTNAIHYNRKGGKIVIRVKREESLLRIEVEDTGIGIPQNQLSRIFERFYRLENARALYPEGSGLGLSIIRHVAGLLNGRVGVSSEVELGSLFWVEIPFSE